MAIMQSIKVPLVSVNDTKLTVQELPFANGDKVEKGAIVLIFETSKTAYDVEAETDGYIQYACVVGTDYAVGEEIAMITSTQEEVVAVAKEIKTKPVQASTTVFEGETVFSNAALALMKDHKIDRSAFAGKDFVSVLEVNQKLGIKEAFSGTVVKQNSAVVNVDKTKVIVEKLSSNKKKEIEYLSAVQSSDLISTVNNFIELDGVFDNLNKKFKTFKNSLLPVTIYETARLLKEYRKLNAFFSGEEIAFYNSVNIGFAVDLDKGLKVLKIPDADQKSIFEIEDMMLDLSGKYIDDKLHISDLTDITFTITDLSNEGVSFFHPLINMMNSSILGISSIDSKLNRSTFSLSFDHRVTEGKLAANFLKELKSRIESFALDKSYRKSGYACFKCFKTLEEDLSRVGFSRCVTPDGEDALICQSCLKGF